MPAASTGRVGSVGLTGYNHDMKVVTGRVVGGRIELDSPLREGASVAVLTTSEEGSQLTPEDQQELAEALASIRRGEFEDGHSLLAELKGR